MPTDVFHGRRASLLRALLVLGVLLVFVLDLVARQAVAVGTLYVVAVLLALGLSSLCEAVAVAATCSVATLVGHASSGVDGPGALAGRVLIVLALWLPVALVWRRKAPAAPSRLPRAEQQQQQDQESSDPCVLLGSTQVCVITADAGRTIVGTSEAATSLLGYGAGELVGCPLRRLFPAAHAEASVEHPWSLDDVGASSDHSGELQVVHKNGRRLRMHCRVCMTHEGGEPLRILLSPPVDAAPRAQALDAEAPAHASPCPGLGPRLLCGAYYDILTGLPNRVLFMKRLARAFACSKHDQRSGFAVLFMDLDRFKVINDSLGHDLGDELLRQVAQRLLRCTRPCDTAARLGGDEFVLLLDGARLLPDPISVAKRIQYEMRDPFRLRGHEVFVTASIGIAMSSWQRDRCEPILRDADAAMYRAKACGRARFQVFDSAMHESAVARLRLETELRHAIGQPESSFRVVYQPIVSLSSGTLSGFEALLRWEHPQRGTLYPRDFIAAAEDTGLIVPLGWWSLRQACRQARVWHQSFPDLPPPFVAVNLSRRQLAQPDLVKQVRTTLRETGLAAGWLRLEISEQAVGDLTPSTRERLGRLSQTDVLLQLDDFGAGHAALAQLDRLPLHAVKVDCSLFGSERHAARRAEIVKNMVNLIHLLDVGAIAEGVETPDLAAQLRTSLCQHAQGFFFSEPLAPAAAGRIIATRPRW